jgi:hypothetical protein
MEKITSASFIVKTEGSRYIMISIIPIIATIYIVFNINDVYKDILHNNSMLLAYLIPVAISCWFFIKLIDKRPLIIIDQQGISLKGRRKIYWSEIKNFRIVIRKSWQTHYQLAIELFSEIDFITKDITAADKDFGAILEVMAKYSSNTSVENLGFEEVTL